MNETNETLNEFVTQTVDSMPDKTISSQRSTHHKVIIFRYISLSYKEFNQKFTVFPIKTFVCCERSMANRNDKYFTGTFEMHAYQAMLHTMLAYITDIKILTDLNINRLLVVYHLLRQFYLSSNLNNS